MSTMQVIPVRKVTDLDLRHEVAGDPLGPLDKLNRKLCKFQASVK